MSKKRSSEEEAPRTNRSVSPYFRDLIVIDIDPEDDRFVEKFIRMRSIDWLSGCERRARAGRSLWRPTLLRS